MSAYIDPCVAALKEVWAEKAKSAEDRVEKVLAPFHELLREHYGATLVKSIGPGFKGAGVSMRLDPLHRESTAADAVRMFCHVRDRVPAMSEYEISGPIHDDQYCKGRYGVYFNIWYK